MKQIIIAAVFACAAIVFSSCEKDEGKNPTITFKTGADYVSTDATIAKDSTIKMGIDAAKTEDKDVLKKYSIARSVNGGSDTTLFAKDLSGSEGDKFSHDFTVKVGSKAGNKEKYTFTVINRDGLVGQTSLTITLK